MENYDEIEKVILEEVKREKRNFAHNESIKRILSTLKDNWDSVRRSELREKAKVPDRIFRVVVKLLKDYKLIESSRSFGYETTFLFDEFMEKLLRKFPNFFEKFNDGIEEKLLESMMNSFEYAHFRASGVHNYESKKLAILTRVYNERYGKKKNSALKSIYKIFRDMKSGECITKSALRKQTGLGTRSVRSVIKVLSDNELISLGFYHCRRLPSYDEFTQKLLTEYPNFFDVNCTKLPCVS